MLLRNGSPKVVFVCSAFKDVNPSSVLPQGIVSPFVKYTQITTCTYPDECRKSIHECGTGHSNTWQASARGGITRAR